MINEVQKGTLGTEFSLSSVWYIGVHLPLHSNVAREGGQGKTGGETAYLTITNLVNLKKLALKKESEPSWYGSTG